MSEVNIQVQETVENVEIVAQNNVIEVNITRQSGGGAVDSVNGQTGVVVLDADDISDASTSNKFVTASEKTAITHANRSILDAITEAFTTALKTAYDSAVAWINTNGTNLLNHLTNTSNPHNTTATQVDALQRDGSNANSDVDLGAFSLNAKSFHAKGTAGAGHLGLKHQSANPTASGQETVIFAGSDGEPRYKNDGGAIEQFASRAWVSAQGFITNVISALGYTPLPTQAGSTTGTVVTFVTDRVYGTIASPETGNITADVTGAQIGVTNIIIHNSGTAPTFGSQFKKLSGSGNYITSQVNYIYCTFINSTEIIYSINQRT